MIAIIPFCIVIGCFAYAWYLEHLNAPYDATDDDPTSWP